ncbi:MAG TPA: hypothetical protein V6D09_23150 [Leptolyngbyaceae cyanobacterium]
MEIDWEAVVEAEMNAGGALAVDAEFLALREKVLRGEVKKALLQNASVNFSSDAACQCTGTR